MISALLISKYYWYRSTVKVNENVKIANNSVTKYRTFWRHYVLFDIIKYLFTSWRTFIIVWCYDVFFWRYDIFCWHQNVFFFTSWCPFLTSWHTFLHYDFFVCHEVLFSSAVPSGSGAFQMPSRPSSSASSASSSLAAAVSTLKGERANLRNASVTFSLFWHEASLGWH